MDLEDLDYDFDERLIAHHPPADRDGGRLLTLDVDGAVGHRKVRELPELLPPCLWVVNNTKVVQARLHGTRKSGGKVEFLLLEPAEGSPGCFRALGKANKRLKVGDMFVLGDGEIAATITDRDELGFLTVQLESDGPIGAAIEAKGQVPLPPYIRRAPVPEDRERYQTIFAGPSGAAAAPTAGLHFTRELVDALKERGHRFTSITLHVGVGTFRPVNAERLADHVMHEEWFHVDAAAAKAIREARADGLPIVAVGTTAVRALESSVKDGTVTASQGRTSLFIRPPYSFQVVDGLMTNFHLPRSTLLALVMAMGGESQVRAAYENAVQLEYRLFSYGDAMLLLPRPRT